MPDATTFRVVVGAGAGGEPIERWLRAAIGDVMHAVFRRAKGIPMDEQFERRFLDQLSEAIKAADQAGVRVVLEYQR